MNEKRPREIWCEDTKRAVWKVQSIQTQLAALLMRMNDPEHTEEVRFIAETARREIIASLSTTGILWAELDRLATTLYWPADE